MADEFGSSYQSDEQTGSPPPRGNGGVNGRGSSIAQQAQYGGSVRMDDDGQWASTVPTTPMARTGFNVAGEYGMDEAYGDAPVPVSGLEAAEESAEMGEEIGNPEVQESAEEYYEATPEQLRAGAAEVGQEGWLDAIGGLAGSLLGESSETIAEAGVALEGAQEAGVEEFFPILAALVPTLLSSIGPTVAKKVVSKLTPRARAGIKRLAKTAVRAGPAKPVKSILSIFARLLESEQAKAASESETEVGEELDQIIEQVAASAEMILGIDEREYYPNTTAEPLRRICELRITFPNGRTFKGTGFFIGRRTLATAGHCVYMHSQGGWARKVEVIPAANGTYRPYGTAVSTSFRSVKGWVNSKKPEHDYGCIVLPAGAFGGRNLGWFGLAAPTPAKILGKQVWLHGYPGDKPSENWGMRRAIKTITAKTLIYEIDTVGGQSGAPVYLDMGTKKNRVIGIHNYGSAGGNSATRITPAVFERLSKWAVL